MIFTIPFFAQPVQAQLPTGIGWSALPATTSLQGSGACPPNNFDGDPYLFSDTCDNVIRAWSGAIADTTANRLLIWGGGHNNYYGNEIYALDLTANPITLTRIKDPTVPTNYNNSTNCIDGIPPGSPNFAPNSRESYGGMAFIPSTNRMLILNGALACLNGYGSVNTWSIPLTNLSNASSWVHEDVTLTGPKPGSNGGASYGNIAAYDPNSGLVFVNDAAAIYTYNYQTNTYALITTPQGFGTGIYLSGAIDPTRKLFVLAGGCSKGSCGPGAGVFVADISNPASTFQQNWTAATLADPVCAEFLNGGVNPINSGNPGFVFDSVAKVFVGWPNQGNSVYLMTPDPVNQRLTCQKQTFANGPPNSAHVGGTPNTSNGTFGRFQYFPGLDVFALVNDWNIPGYILRLQNSPGFTLSATPSSASVTPGGNATYTVSASAYNGFSGSVNLAVSGLPTGASASFNPTSIGAGSTSTLTVTTTASTPAGSSTVTITGTSGTVTSTTTVTLNVTASPDFTLSATPSSASVTPGGSATYQASVAGQNGFSGSVKLTVSGLPTGATGSFNPTTIGAGSSSTLTVTTTASTPAGSSTLTITGTSGSLVHSVNVTVVVTSAGVGSIQYVQSNYADPQTSNSSLGIPYTLAQAGGNLNVVVVGWGDSTTGVTSVTDTMRNTYTRAVGPTVQPGYLSQSIYYARNIAAAPANGNTVTVTFNAAAAFPDVRILEYSGADPNSPVDVVAAGTGTNSPTNSGPATTTNGSDLLFGASMVWTSNTGAGAGFTSRILTQPDHDLVEDEMVMTTGSYSATAPLNNPGPWIMQMVAFKAVNGGGGTAPSITGLNPTSGTVGTSVTISGANFGATQGSSTVTFNGTAATPTSWSGTSIAVKVPAGAGTGNVVVTVGGVASNGVSFTVTTAAVTISFVQSNYADPQTSNSSLGIPYTLAQTGGNLNVVVVGWADSTTSVSSVTDTMRNTYTRAVGPTVQPGYETQSIYYAKNIAAAPANGNTVTVTFNTAAAYPDIRILEYSGADPNNPVDVVAAGTGTNSPTNSGPATTTNGSDLLFGASEVWTSNTGAGAGFTSRILTQSDHDLVEDEMVMTTGSYSATAPLNSPGPWIMQLVALRAAH